MPESGRAVPSTTANPYDASKLHSPQDFTMLSLMAKRFDPNAAAAEAPQRIQVHGPKYKSYPYDASKLQIRVNCAFPDGYRNGTMYFVPAHTGTKRH